MQASHRFANATTVSPDKIDLYEGCHLRLRSTVVKTFLGHGHYLTSIEGHESSVSDDSRDHTEQMELVTSE